MPVKIIHNGSFAAEPVALKRKRDELQRIGGYERFLCNNSRGMNDFKPLYS